MRATAMPASPGWRACLAASGYWTQRRDDVPVARVAGSYLAACQ